jgi:hypothetical protein
LKVFELDIPRFQDLFYHTFTHLRKKKTSPP